MQRESSSARILATVFGIILGFVGILMTLPVPEPGADGADGAGTLEAYPAFAIVGARVFDGIQVLPEATVWVDGPRIHAVGTDLELPDDLPRIDGAGHTVLPGLFDAHVHTWGESRADAVRFGVTTLLDQFTAQAALDEALEDRRAGGSTHRADLFSAGILATVAGGHGTQYGIEVPTVDDPEGVEQWVKDRKAAGSDWIKIVIEHGYDRSEPTLDDATARRLIDAAHAEGLLAVVHIATLDDALKVADFGADGLVHIWYDRVPTDDEVAQLKDSGIFVIPAMAVLEGMVDPSPSMALAELDGFAAGLSETQRSSLTNRFPVELAPGFFDVPMESLRKLVAAGIPVLAGTDAPNPATAMGLSIHRELEVLVQAGLEPVQALASATRLAAEAFRVPERGRLEAGALADLVMVEGDPTVEITHTRRLVHVWKAGQPIGRRLAKPLEEAAPLEPKILADFEGESPAEGWSATTDERMGGESTVAFAVEGGALVIRGEILAGFNFPWSGAMTFLGSPAKAVSPEAEADLPPAFDLSGLSELRFRVRGDGRSYTVMLFHGSMQGVPASQSFETDGTWQTVSLPVQGFFGADLGRVRALAFTAGRPTGTFEVEIDDVELR